MANRVPIAWNQNSNSIRSDGLEILGTGLVKTSSPKNLMQKYNIPTFYSNDHARELGVLLQKLKNEFDNTPLGREFNDEVSEMMRNLPNIALSCFKQFLSDAVDRIVFNFKGDHKYLSILKYFMLASQLLSCSPMSTRGKIDIAFDVLIYIYHEIICPMVESKGGWEKVFEAAKEEFMKHPYLYGAGAAVAIGAAVVGGSMLLAHIFGNDSSENKRLRKK